MLRRVASKNTYRVRCSSLPRQTMKGPEPPTRSGNTTSQNCLVQRQHRPPISFDRRPGHRAAIRPLDEAEEDRTLLVGTDVERKTDPALLARVLQGFGQRRGAA